MAHRCPVCGYPDLNEPPRGKSGGGSYEICPSCGFQFGVSDDDRGFTCEQWRARWQKSGMKWSSRGISQPLEWNPRRQLELLSSHTVPAQSPSARKKTVHRSTAQTNKQNKTTN